MMSHPDKYPNFVRRTGRPDNGTKRPGYPPPDSFSTLYSPDKLFQDCPVPDQDGHPLSIGVSDVRVRLGSREAMVIKRLEPTVNDHDFWEELEHSVDHDRARLERVLPRADPGALRGRIRGRGADRAPGVRRGVDLGKWRSARGR